LARLQGVFERIEQTVDVLVFAFYDGYVL